MDDSLSPTRLVLHAAIRFEPQEVQSHLDAHHPHCPPTIRRRIIKEVCGRVWVKTKIGQAVGITAINFLRHSRTSYEKALRNTHPRDYDALRKRANRKAAAIIRSWSQTASEGVAEE